MKKKSSLVVLGLALLLAVASVTAWAVQTPDAVVTISMAPGTSDGGVVPDNSGESDQYFYVYNIGVGDSISDSIPVHICTSTAYTGTNPFSYELTLNFTGPNGDSLVGVGLPSNPSFSADGCQDVNISVNSGPYNVVNNYAANTDLQKDTFTPSGGGNHNSTNPLGNVVGGIHIKVNVTQETTLSCLVTDSDFNFLVDCSGQAVRSGTGGRFAIVTNKKGTEVSTNPGQFYYNALWTNHTGSDQTVTMTFQRFGVLPKGAQAIHASIFPSFPDLTDVNFDLVNSGIPSGSDDALENVMVPDGSTLWVDYHLEWAGLGSLAPAGIGVGCVAANQPFSVLAIVSWPPDHTMQCTAGASGYKK